jgi:hypothetical protein
MEDAPPPTNPDFTVQPTFDVDFQPLYALTEQQYQAIINQLSNLVIAIIEQYNGTEQEELAQQIAAHAHAVLQDYDDDVAEKIEQTLRAQRGSEAQSLTDLKTLQEETGIKL